MHHFGESIPVFLTMNLISFIAMEYMTSPWLIYLEKSNHSISYVYITFDTPVFSIKQCKDTHVYSNQLSLKNYECA